MEKFICFLITRRLTSCNFCHCVIIMNTFAMLYALSMSIYWISRHNIEKFCLLKGKHLTGEFLDFGCGSTPYKSCFPLSQSYIGLEYDRKLDDGKYYSDGTNYYYDGALIPFADNSFDAIVSFQVLEHIKDLHTSLCELKRVSRPGAVFLFTVPLLWPEHETPFDFRRFTRWGITDIFDAAGLEVSDVVPLGSIYDVIFSFILDYINHHPSPLTKVLCKFIVPILNTASIVLNFLDPWACRSSRHCYLDLGVMATNPD